MTATHSVVPGRFLGSGAFPPTTWPVLSGDLRRPLGALHRSAQFWAADGRSEDAAECVPPLPFGDDWSDGPVWLMRRPAGRPTATALAATPTAAFIEMRGPDESAAAHQLAAEAFRVSKADIAPRRTTVPPEPLHLRTWGLLGEAGLLSCALTVVAGDIMVLCVIATLPALQGRGLGSRIVRELHQLHERTGVIRDFVACPPLDAVPAFERLGYDLVTDLRATVAGGSRNRSALRALREA